MARGRPACRLPLAVTVTGTGTVSCTVTCTCHGHLHRGTCTVAPRSLARCPACKWCRGCQAASCQAASCQWPGTPGPTRKSRNRGLESEAASRSGCWPGVTVAARPGVQVRLRDWSSRLYTGMRRRAGRTVNRRWDGPGRPSGHGHAGTTVPVRLLTVPGPAGGRPVTVPA